MDKVESQRQRSSAKPLSSSLKDKTHHPNNQQTSQQLSSSRIDVIWSRNNGGQRDEAEEFHNLTAPTLPTYSPHSPLHLYSHFHSQNQLSARYIHNKVKTVKKSVFSEGTESLGSNASNHTKNEESSSLSQPNEFTSSALLSHPKLKSTLLCNCETDESFIHRATSQKSLSSKAEQQCLLSYKGTNANSNTIFSQGVRRLVATRNAATSPNLDIRKLGQMTTVSATLSNIEDHNLKNHKIKVTAPSKSSLEKSNSLGESKPQKILRTTRSLSPRPPIRHQQAIIVSDENEIISVKITPPSQYELKTDKVICKPTATDKSKSYKKNKTSSKSEQTSPNITDFAETKFTYNKIGNRSTGCLVYVPSDPWLKMAGTKNPSKLSKQVSLISKDINIDPITNKRIEEDPWVKRAEINTTVPLAQERFRQGKSFSTTKFDVKKLDIKKSFLRPQLRRCKIPYQDDEKIIPLQSAPTSPHYLKSPINPFSSAFSLACTRGDPNSNSPPRSASFSPARIKDIQNPFADFGSLSRVPPSPPLYISVATVTSERQTESERSFLDVSNPNLLQARHSFSSALNSGGKEELQLSIRRLSEEMKITQKSLTDTVQLSLSDRNVNNGLKANHVTSGVSTLRTNIEGADFSDYLAKFQYKEAKKATIITKSTLATKGLADLNDPIAICGTHDIPMTPYMTQKSQAQSDPLLETTC